MGSWIRKEASEKTGFINRHTLMKFGLPHMKIDKPVTSWQVVVNNTRLICRKHEEHDARR
jgi:hypothetical protein